MVWTWRYEDSRGKQVAGSGETFTNQSEAESWIGGKWRTLVGKGVTKVTLLHDNREEYTMSLEPAQ